MNQGALDFGREFEQFYQSNSKICVVKYFYNESQAYLYAARLTEAGIKNFISNTNTSTIFPFAGGGISVHVKERDLSAAKSIIEKLDERKSADEGFQDFHDADRAEILYEKAISEGDFGKKYKLLVCLMFILVFLIVVRSYLRASHLVNISFDFF